MARGFVRALVLLSCVACGADRALSTRSGFRGSVVITVALEGNGSDANGFTYAIGQTRSGTVVAGQAVTVTDVAEGTHTVRLLDLAPHCHAQQPEKTIVVTDGATAAVDFIAECFGGFAYAEWYSPNNQQIFYVSDDGATRKLTRLIGRNIAREWSPDGTRLLFENDTNGSLDLYTVRADGTDHRRLTTHPYNDVVPRWSPDGTQIVFSRRTPGASTSSTLHVVSADGSSERPILEPRGFDYDAAWTRDGTEILFSCDRFARQFDLCITKTDGSNVRSIATLGALAQARPSPDGSHVAMYGFDTSQSIYVAPLDGSVLLKLTPAFSALSFDWSPDGRQLVMQTATDKFRIHRVNRDGTDLRELGQDSVSLTVPRWSPDGAWIMYVRNHPIDQQVWIMRADGSSARSLTEGYAYKLNPVWNPKAGARPSNHVR